MDYLNTYKLIDEEIAFAATNGMVLNLLSVGSKGAWFQKEDDRTNWIEECDFGFDLLEHFPFIREEMKGKILEISFKKCFQVKLIIKIRIGGYKEPWQDECIVITNGSTVYQALAKMNLRLKRKKQVYISLEKTTPIADFETYKRKMQRIKK